MPLPVRNWVQRQHVIGPDPTFSWDFLRATLGDCGPVAWW